MMRDFYIDFITRTSDSSFRIEGYLVDDENMDVHLVSSAAEEQFIPKDETHTHRFVNGAEKTVRELTAEIVFETHDTLRVIDSEGRRLGIRTNRFSGLSSLSGSYRKNGAVLLRKKRYGISIRSLSKFRSTAYEICYLGRLIFNWRLPAFGAALSDTHLGAAKRAIKALLIVGEAILTIPRALLLRITYHVMATKKRSSIWLVSDRGMAAGDNGEALFRYIKKMRTDKRRDVYFILSRSSSDYQRIAEIGPVLDPNSFRYKVLFLLADKIISSHADIEVTNPFRRQLDHFVDLFSFDFVFLQHGIIRNDLSAWLNRYEQNIDLFVTSAQKEYDSILKYPYYYSPENILLSGLPRYDLLENDPKKKLLIVPTYRKSLLRLKTDKYGRRGYDSEFKKSEYFSFYSRLMNDERLINAMKKHNMTGEFYLHPNFAAQRQDFKDNTFFTVPEYPYNYRDAFKEGALLVSDYSSVVFDFSYLKKPIIYTKFDVDTFFEGHTYTQGDFFSDDDDGFGPVTYTYNELVDAIISYIENGCKMDETYKERVDSFFHKTDRHNSERVYEAIVRKGI